VNQINVKTVSKKGVVSKYDSSTLRGVVRVGMEKFNFDGTVWHSDGLRRPPQRGDHVNVIFSKDNLVLVRAVISHEFEMEFFATDRMRKEFLARLQKMKRTAKKQEQRAVGSRKFEEAIKAQAHMEILDDLIETVRERMWEV
jgi:hypothetical protein